MLLVVIAIWFLINTALLIASRKTIRSGGTPYLINVKGKRLIPLMSWALLSLILVISFIALKITDVSITDYSDWQQENQTRIMMTADKTYPTAEAVRIGIREGSVPEDYFISDGIIHLDYPLTRLSANNDGSSSGCRIAVLGDSFVWGQSLINQNSVMYRQLYYELTRRGYNCSVWGIGVGGASTFDEYLWLAESSLLEDIKPDILLIGYVRNDPELQSRQDAYQAEKTDSFAKKILAYPIGAINDYCPNVGYLLANRLQSSDYMALNLRYVSAENLAAYTEEVVKPLSELTKAKGIETVFVSFPRITEKAYNNKFYPPVKALFEQYGIPFFDCTPEYTAFFSSGDHAANAAVNPVDLHPGTASNRFFSLYMADLLEAEYGYLLGERSIAGEQIYNVSINDWLPQRLNVTEESVSPNAGVFHLEYPTVTEANSFLYLPVNKAHVAVSFAYPVDVAGITLEGDRLESAEIWCNTINEALGYDDLRYASLGSQQGNICVWNDDTDDRVTTIFIHAETAVTNEPLPLRLTVTCADGGVRP